MSASRSVAGWRCRLCGREVLDNLPAPRPFARLATHFRFKHPGHSWKLNVERFDTVIPIPGTFAEAGT